MKILGISAYYHDSAAALLVDGEIVAAAQEERFTRIKHDSEFPIHAIQKCLEISQLNINEIDYFCFFEKPLVKFERLIETYLFKAPVGYTSFKKALPIWMKDKLFQKDNIIKELMKIGISSEDDALKKLLFSDHHLSHAASAFFPSPFNESIVLTVDGVGEWATTSVYIGKDNQLKLIKEIRWPHSLGLLYSAFTYYTGFKVNSGEYKLMGLAPYGVPKYFDLIMSELIDVKEDGSYWLNNKYFSYETGLKMVNNAFCKLFGLNARTPDEEITQHHMDLAASIQKVTEEIMLRISRSLRKEFNIPNICLAGGVALNCVANGKIISEKIFDNVWVQPASGDAGGALGAALAAYYIELKKPRIVNTKTYDHMKGSYLGTKYDLNEISKQLNEAGAKFEILDDEQLYNKTVESLKKGHAIGWFQGAMEFGPRALGNRSIIGDPRNPEMQKNLNLKIKYRESFRPFAPSVLEAKSKEYFDLECQSPYMLVVADVNQSIRRELNENENKLFGINKLNTIRSTIPAVTHVDYSARVQTVSKETNPRYYKLIEEFEKNTGCSVIVNTSFNVRGEPIVESPKDAFRCFMGTEMDTLVVGNCFLEKTNQDEKLKLDYKNQFELD